MTKDNYLHYYGMTLDTEAEGAHLGLVQILDRGAELDSDGYLLCGEGGRYFTKLDQVRRAFCPEDRKLDPCLIYFIKGLRPKVFLSFTLWNGIVIKGER